jgi:hypothetical protein
MHAEDCIIKPIQVKYEEPSPQSCQRGEVRCAAGRISVSWSRNSATRPGLCVSCEHFSWYKEGLANNDLDHKGGGRMCGWVPFQPRHRPS